MTNFTQASVRAITKDIYVAAKNSGECQKKTVAKVMKAYSDSGIDVKKIRGGFEVVSSKRFHYETHKVVKGQLEIVYY